MKIKPHNIEWNIEENIVSFWDPILNTGWSLNEAQSNRDASSNLAGYS